MKKLNKYNDKLVAIYKELDNLIGELEEKRDAIEERVIEKDRDMTDTEQERCDGAICVEDLKILDEEDIERYLA